MPKRNEILEKCTWIKHKTKISHWRKKNVEKAPSIRHVPTQKKKRLELFVTTIKLLLLSSLYNNKALESRLLPSL